MRRAAFSLTVLLAAGPASAHMSVDALSGATLWNYDPWLAAPLYIAGFAFWLGTRNLWRAAGFGRGVGLTRVAAYWSAWLLLAIAFLSPLHWLGERLFAAHMLEHELLLLVAAPLFAYARPVPAALWSLPSRWRRRIGGVARLRTIGKSTEWLASPILMTGQQAVAIYLWHVPSVYQWALRDDFAHRLEHVSFFASAYLFWRALLLGPGRARAQKAVAVGCLFVTMLHSGLLGALLTLSPRLWYPEQERLAADFGMTPLEDQQLAGIIMWIPMSGVYTLAALWLAHDLLNSRLSYDRSSLSVSKVTR